jgi:hypothetical protein
LSTADAPRATPTGALFKFLHGAVRTSVPLVLPACISGERLFDNLCQGRIVHAIVFAYTMKGGQRPFDS